MSRKEVPLSPEVLAELAAAYRLAATHSDALVRELNEKLASAQVEIGMLKRQLDGLLKETAPKGSGDVTKSTKSQDVPSAPKAS